MDARKSRNVVIDEHDRMWQSIAFTRRLLYWTWLLMVVFLVWHMLDRNNAFAAEPVDPVFERKVASCADIIGVWRPSLAGSGQAWKAARIIVTASRDAKLECGWEMLACLAEPESGFNPEAVNGYLGKDGKWHGTKCRGLLQIHPSWADDMRRAGLDFYTAQDNTTWGAMMIQAKLNKGCSLYNSISDWSVRSKRLMRRYEQLVAQR